MTQNKPGNSKNEVVILSDDEDIEEYDPQINENGKRLGGSNTNQRADGPKQNLESEQENFVEDIDSEELEHFEDELDDEKQFYLEEEHNVMSTITKSQTLPEDHEPVIISERTAVNPLQDLDDIFTEFKSQCIKSVEIFDEFETSFACGSLLKEDAPNIAITVEGVPAPIAFPFQEKDAERIFSAHSALTERNDLGLPVCLELDTAKIVINLTFLEYLFDTILPQVVAYLGVEQDIAKTTRLQAKKIYLHANGGKFNLPKSLQNGAYGTAVLVLPSKFSGGDTSADYNGENILFHNEGTSPESAYYMAWYNDVELNSEPVTTGYRIAIAFSLLHNIETADESDSLIKYLQKKRVEISQGILSSEEQEKSKVYFERATKYFESQKDSMKYPIAYMLDYSYASPYLTVDQLKSSDKAMTKFLEKVAAKAGYLTFLGLIEREVEGKVEDDNNCENTESISNDCPIDEEGIYLTQRVMYDDYILTSLIDPSGENILEKPIGLDSKDEPVIVQGSSWYARRKPDSQEFSDTVDVGDVAVKYWYSNASAVVFLPEENLPAILEMSRLSDY